MTGSSFTYLRRSLAGSVAAVALLATIPAMAQISGANSIGSPTPGVGNASSGLPAAGTTQDVVVTGSRLRTSNLTSEAPVTVVTSQQIEQSSAQTVEDVLRKIPSIGSEGNFSTTNNGGNGSSCIDLRNLGITRTLVLVDGRRFVHTGYGLGNDCVDLDTIPIGLIDRIEILKDGASSIYGADAVAGVINIVMKKNFTGTQINLGGNITASGDDKQGDISGTTGFDFDQGRGNVAISGRYLDRGPVQQKDRDWADPVVTIDNGPGQPFGYGSGYPVSGRFFSADGTVNDETVKNGKLVPFVNNSSGGPGDRYDYGQLQYLSSRETQGNLAGNTHYDINDHITAYASAYYTHKNTQTQLSGQPITGAVNTTQQFDIPQGNPYAEALGINSDLTALRRVSDWGPRDYNTGTDTWQMTGGLKGNITGNWDYDAYYTYGHAKTTLQYTNQVNFDKLEQEMGFEGTGPVGSDTGIYNPAVCTSHPGCVLANPFGVGSFSKAAINYASFTSNAQAITQLHDVGATVTNNKLFQLPYGPLGLAVGMEHRGEQGAYHPDPTIESGASTANFELPTGGGFNVTEVFGELSIPLLKNLIMAKDLSADISGRWSDYNTFGSVYTWKAGLNWTPVKDIRFRGNIGTATREPAIEEAFGGDTGSFNQAIDPCAQTASYGASAGIVAANCAKKGINSATFQQASTQINTLVGGNPNLLPETSRTYTIGTVLTPRWVKGFSATVDYFHTSINNSISETSTQYVLDQCYTSANLSSPLCADAGTRNGSGQVSSVQALYENLGVTRTNGIDFDLNYLIRLGGGHSLSFSNELVDTIGYEEQLVNGGPFLNLKGRLSTANSTYAAGYPVIKDNLTTTYAKGGFSLSWTVRYIDGMTYNDGSSDYTASAERYYHTNEVFFHDIEATYNWRKVQFVGGMDNVFDKTPPFVLDGSTNTAPNVYGADIFGRFFYAKAQVRF